MKKFFILLSSTSFALYSLAQSSISYVLPGTLSADYNMSGNYSVLSEERILGWARAQGFEITADHPMGGLQGKQAFLTIKGANKGPKNEPNKGPNKGTQ